jgi:hypothetical protein
LPFSSVSLNSAIELAFPENLIDLTSLPADLNGKFENTDLNIDNFAELNYIPSVEFENFLNNL